MDHHAETLVGRLLQAADGDAKKAERDILYIDEIDTGTTEVDGDHPPEALGWLAAKPIASADLLAAVGAL